MLRYPSATTTDSEIHSDICKYDSTFTVHSTHRVMSKVLFCPHTVLDSVFNLERETLSAPTQTLCFSSFHLQTCQAALPLYKIQNERKLENQLDQKKEIWSNRQQVICFTPSLIIQVTSTATFMPLFLTTSLWVYCIHIRMLVLNNKQTNILCIRLLLRVRRYIQEKKIKSIQILNPLSISLSLIWSCFPLGWSLFDCLPTKMTPRLGSTGK